MTFGGTIRAFGGTLWERQGKWENKSGSRSTFRKRTKERTSEMRCVVDLSFPFTFGLWPVA